MGDQERTVPDMRQVPVNTTEECTGPGLAIRWQTQPIAAGVNGSTVEQVIRAAIARLTDLDAKLPCDANRLALQHLGAAVDLLDARARDRTRRGVIGTDQP